MRSRFIIRLLLLITTLTPAVPCRAAADASIALVRTERLQKQGLADTITGYGMVGVDPRATFSGNFPVAGQLLRLLVSQGEQVRKGAPLAELAVSPTDALGYTQARSNLTFARSELGRITALAGRQLATRSQLDQARKNLQDAEAALAVQQTVGADRTTRLLSAPFSGIVTQVTAMPGDRLQAGAPLMQLARADRLQALIGIEPEEVGRVHAGMTVRVASVFDEHTVYNGRVSKVFGMINPQTRLVDLVVTLQTGSQPAPTPGTRVKGVISLTRRTGFAVPRRAVLKDDGGPYLFVVQNGRARRVAVKTGLETRDRIMVSGRLTAGDRVVVLGNYELRDGMAVREGEP